MDHGMDEHYDDHYDERYDHDSHDDMHFDPEDFFGVEQKGDMDGYGGSGAMADDLCKKKVF